MAKDALLKPIKIGRSELPNRVFMAPMTRSRADNSENAATPLIAEYYSQRASAGLLITEVIVTGKQVHIPAPPGGGYRDGVTQKDICAGRWLSLSLFVGLELRKIRAPYG